MNASGEMPRGVTLIVSKPVTLSAFRNAVAEARRRRGVVIET